MAAFFIGIFDMKHILFVLGLLLVPTSAIAQDIDPARTIVEVSLTPKMLSGALEAQRPLMIAALGAQLTRLGVDEAYHERFLDIVWEEMADAFLEQLRQEAVGLYHRHFSNETLTDVADFLSTPSGRLWLDKTPQLMVESAQIGMQIGTKIGAEVSLRVAKRLEEEGLELFGSPEVVEKLKGIHI